MNVLYQVEEVLLYLCLIESFYQECVVNFVKSFFCVYLYYYMIFLLLLLTEQTTFSNFHMLRQTFISERNLI